MLSRVVEARVVSAEADLAEAAVALEAVVVAAAVEDSADPAAARDVLDRWPAINLATDAGAINRFAARLPTPGKTRF